MTDRTSTEAGDLAYLKRLAEAGRGEPAPFLLLMAVFGGGYGLFGLIISVAGLIHMATMEGPLRPDGIIQTLAPWSFGAATLAFAVAAVWTVWRTFGPRPIPVSRSATAIWSAAFLGLVTVFAAMFMSLGAPHPIFMPDNLAPVLLILWGCAWWATAITSDRRWLMVVGLGSFAAAAVLPIATPNFWGMPLLTACLLLLAFLPAVVLMRSRRR